MDFKAILTSLSGPINAVIRYALTALGAWVVTKGYFDSAAWDSIAGGILMIVPALIGALIDTKEQKIAQVAALPEVAAVAKTSGERVVG